MVESLTSYLTRLAEAHSVFPRVLVAKEITPVVDPHLAGRATYRSTGFWKQSPVLNGVTSLAAGMIQALQQLTQRNDLRFLTMLPWKEVLADTRLVRRTRAWCPMCYEEWRVSHQEVYDPLLWALQDITYCSRHGVQLQQHCPNPDCGRMLYPLYSTAQPGYCTWCHQWLGQTLSFTQRGEEDWAWQAWINHAVGELLATAPTLSAFPSRENVAAALTVYEQMTTSRNAFARQLQVGWKSILEWKQGTKGLQLGSLLRVCSHLNVSPLHFLTNRAEETRGTQQEIPSIISPSLLAKKTLRQFDSDGVRRALVEALQTSEEPPPSVRELGRRWGYDVSKLISHFPDLCRSISQRYVKYRTSKRAQRLQRKCNEIRQTMYDLHEQGYYPSQVRVQKFLSMSAAFKEHEARTTWRETMQELGWR
jgi:TniQ